MGRNRKHKLILKLKQDAFYEKALEKLNAEGSGHQSAKEITKLKRRQKNKSKKYVPITKEYPWYLVKVYDTVQPTQEFLQESFGSLIDTEFTMLGFHHSTTSARFYLENDNAAATSIKLLNKRMQGSKGKLLNIMVEPCKEFLLLNTNQLAVVKQVLFTRYSPESRVLDLTNFHHDPVFLEHRILPVLWDPIIFKQVLISIKNNIPDIVAIVLCKNRLRLTSIRVLGSSLSAYPLQGINLENNEIENIKELLKLLKVFPVSELKLEGNRCLTDIKNPVLYIKTVQSMLNHLKTLDGVDVVSYLRSKDNLNDESTDLNVSQTLPIKTESVVTEPLLKQFLKEYYACFDSEHRAQLVNAYIPTAKFAIQSDVAGIPAGQCEGHDCIREVLNALPATQHDMPAFNLEVVNLSPSIGQVKVSGQLKVAGVAEVVSFVHELSVVPYNVGLGCSMSVIGFR